MVADEVGFDEGGVLQALMTHNILTLDSTDTKKYKSGRTKVQTARLEVSAGDVLFYYIFAKLIALFGTKGFPSDIPIPGTGNIAQYVKDAKSTMGDYFSTDLAMGLSAAGRKKLAEEGQVDWTVPAGMDREERTWRTQTKPADQLWRNYQQGLISYDDYVLAMSYLGLSDQVKTP